jgi:hypothetical protein
MALQYLASSAFDDFDGSYVVENNVRAVNLNSGGRILSLSGKHEMTSCTVIANLHEPHCHVGLNIT